MSQIMLATRYLHENNIVHRDLKPANILIFENKPDILTFKLCDFGVSKVVNVTAKQTGLETIKHLFTMNYAAPEQLG